MSAVADGAAETFDRTSAYGPWNDVLSSAGRLTATLERRGRPPEVLFDLDTPDAAPEATERANDAASL